MDVIGSSESSTFVLTIKYRAKDGGGDEGSGGGSYAAGRAPAEEMKEAPSDLGRQIPGRGREPATLPEDEPDDGGGGYEEDPVDEEVVDEGEEEYPEDDYEQDGAD